MLMLVVLIIDSFNNSSWVCPVCVEQFSRLWVHSSERDGTVPVLMQFVFSRGKTDKKTLQILVLSAVKEIKQGDRVWLETPSNNSRTAHLLCPKHCFSALTHLYMSACTIYMDLYYSTCFTNIDSPNPQRSYKVDVIIISNLQMKK